jgi:hypothetical protein
MRSLHRAGLLLIHTSSTSTPPQTEIADDVRSAESGRAFMKLAVALSAGVTVAWVLLLVAVARWLIATIF